MKISEMIERLQDLLEVAGDVEVIIASPRDRMYEPAAAETQRVIPAGNYNDMRCWTDEFDMEDDNIITLIHIY